MEKVGISMKFASVAGATVVVLLLGLCAIAPVAVAENVSVTEFVGGIKEATLLFNESRVNDTLAIELPRGATVVEAEMTLEGIQGIEKTFEYLDFSSGTAGNDLWAKYNTSFVDYPPAFDPSEAKWAGSSVADQKGVKKDDDVYWDIHTPDATQIPPPEDYPIQLYHFNPKASAVGYKITWNGFSRCKENLTNMYGCEVWLYNHTAQDWELVANYSSNMMGDVTLEPEFASTSGYISSDGAVDVAIVGLHAVFRWGRPHFFDNGHLFTDYIGLGYCTDVKHPFPEGVNLTIGDMSVLSTEGPFSYDLTIGEGTPLRAALQEVVDSYEVKPGNITVPLTFSVEHRTLGMLRVGDLIVSYEPFVNEAPVWEGAAEVHVDEDSDWTQVLQLETSFTDDQGQGGLELEIASVSEPAMLSARINADAAPERYLEVKPFQDFFGEVEVVLRATDVFGASTDSTPIIVSVDQVADKPKLFNPGTQSVNESETLALSIPVQDVDLPDDELTFSDTTDLFDIDPQSGEINWTPGPSDVGEHSIGISVEDRFGFSSSILLVVVVENVNNPPTIVSDLSIQAVQDQVATYTIEAEDWDLPFGDSLTFYAISDQILVDCDPLTGMVTFSPENGHVPLVVVTVGVRDQGLLTDEAELVVEVENVNDAPYLQPLNPGDVLQGAKFIIKLNFDDPDMGLDITPSESLALTFEGPEAFGPDESGRISFTPDQALVGIHQVTYTVTDSGGLQDSIVVAWNVLNVNDVPTIVTAVGPIVTAPEDEVYTLQLEAVDIDGDDLTWRDNSPLFEIDPSGGSIEFLPGQVDVGSHTVTITVSDGNGGEDHVTFELVVENVNDAPVITVVLPPDGTHFKEGAKVTFLAEATDEDGDELTFTWSRDTKVIGTGETLVHGRLPSGTNSIRLEVSDGVATVDRVFNLTVEAEDIGSGMLTTTSMLGILVVVVAIVAAMVLVKRGRGPDPTPTLETSTGREQVGEETEDASGGTHKET